MQTKRSWIAGGVILGGIVWAIARPASEPGTHRDVSTTEHERPAEVPPNKSQPRNARIALPAEHPPETQPVAGPASAPREDDALSALPPLRQPIIRAIREAGVSPAAKRAAMIRAIEESGTSREPWTAAAPHAFDSWRSALPGEAQRGLQMGEVTCFQAGCVAELVFRDTQTYEAAAAAFRALPETNPSHGGRVQTPPGAVSGKLVANWIMLRPETPPAEDDDDA